MFLVDAKNWRGAITSWEGNLYQHTGSRDARQSVSKHHEVAKVHGMAAYMAAEAGMPVTPVICLAGRAAADFGEPQLIRGVWVIPVSALSDWLRTQPSVLERETVERRAVTLMTSFPSTTTDPYLLAAMGTAAAATKPHRERGPQSPLRPPPPRLPKRRGAFGRALRALIAVAFMVGSVALVVKVLPGFVLGGIADAASTGDGGAPSITSSASSSPAAVPRSSAKPTPAPTPKRRATATPAVAMPVSRCAGLTAAQVTKILGRTVQPVAANQGCSWGTRLDDPKTTLVSLLTKTEHRSYESKFVTSVNQRRVVFGASLDSNFQQATALWVATGQPLSVGKRLVLARMDTHVVVSTETLGTTDEKARRIALAMATAVNAAG
ncbi:hypothetical protein N801_04645 [Knoellia aerolata DSM 18566]|uniref:NERD domain-containing protein n=1 Tax=Knoellia aerolata DSM 18566 TaxID=1385519 RepID=A0A0A0K1Z7_9MICO|nr:hypothetical protein N801_04645 [Knoellia aerolata DSM 18566]